MTPAALHHEHYQFIFYIIIIVRGGDLAPSLGGTEKILADQDFWMPISIFTPKISDDHFF